MRCYYLNKIIVRKLPREKRNTHFITQCTYIIRQYAIVYLKITKLSTKRTSIAHN